MSNICARPGDRARWISGVVAAAAVCAAVTGCSGGGGAGTGGGDGTGGSSGSDTTGSTGSAGMTGSTGVSGSTGSGSSVDVSTKGNPFAGASMYVSPDYAKEVESSAAMDSANAALLKKVAAFPTAIWLDRVAAIGGGGERLSLGAHLDKALAQQNSEGKPVVTVIVVYDLPNRDCAAKASNGEFAVDADGLNKYKTQYIDVIAAELKKHPNQRVVAIVEPDSLPNIATNLNQAKCAASEKAYRDGVAYALQTLSSPNVFLYLDAAHSGWLGWPDNQMKVATIYKQVLDAAGGVDKIRGFATNVANYTVLHEQKEQFDYMGNPCHDETTYVTQLAAAFTAAGIANKGFIIDTSRNAHGGIRHEWGYWCNNKGAGLGERPKADPAPGLDAYYWVKPPGESDGTSNTAAMRYDSFCGVQDATQGAPEAGNWFHSYFVELAKNAVPPL